jgi:peptidoglycan hydrolase CwlO-like protein
MNQHLGFGFFGTSKGLQTRNGGVVQSLDVREYLDLDGNQIKLFAGSELLAIKRASIRKDIFFFVIQYGFAKEIQSDRTGTFYGSFVALKNHIAPPEVIQLVLEEIAAGVREYISEESHRFLAEVGDIPLRTPRRLVGISANMTSSGAAPKRRNTPIFAPLPGNNEFLERNSLISFCVGENDLIREDTVYGSADGKIIRFVQKKKALPILDIDMDYTTATEKLRNVYGDVQQQVRDSRKVLNEIGKEKDSLAGHLRKLDEEIEKAHRTYHQLTRDITRENEKIRTLKEVRKEAQVRIKDLEDEIRGIEQKRARRETSISKLKSEIGFYEGEIKKRTHALQETKRLLEQQSTRTDRVTREFRELRQKNQQMRDELTELTGQIRSRHGQLQELKAEVERNREMLRRLKNQMPQM